MSKKHLDIYKLNNNDYDILMVEPKIVKICRQFMNNKLPNSIYSNIKSNDIIV